MKKLLLTCIVIFIAGSSCAKRSVNVQYGEDEYSLKTTSEFAYLNDANLKEAGFRLISDTVPPFPINDPNTTSFYPVSDSGRVVANPFYIHNFGKVEGSDTQHKALAWWRPIKGDAGVYRIRITASDGELSDSKEFTVTVLEANKPPAIFAKYERKK